MSKSYYGRRWTLSFYNNGNGSRVFGPTFWYNSQRAGLDLYFHRWNLTILRERR